MSLVKRSLFAAFVSFFLTPPAGPASGEPPARQVSSKPAEAPLVRATNARVSEEGEEADVFVTRELLDKGEGIEVELPDGTRMKVRMLPSFAGQVLRLRDARGPGKHLRLHIFEAHADARGTGRQTNEKLLHGASSNGTL